jgi:hypothetical protein
MDPRSTGPLPVPPGAEVRSASAKGLTLVAPLPVPAGAVLEFDILLGARPLPVMARVLHCRSEQGPSKHSLEVEFLAMAQIDRDALVDFLTAVGPSALRVREHKEE